MKTCAFTGHRPQHLPFGMNENDERCVKLKEELKEQIINLIEAENVTHFITGMALGVDLYAAEIVLDLKARYIPSAVPAPRSLPVSRPTASAAPSSWTRSSTMSS